MARGMLEWSVLVVPCDPSYDDADAVRSLGVFTAIDYGRALELAKAIHADIIDPEYERLIVLQAYAAV